MLIPKPIPWNKMPSPRSADWGYRVSVCIAIRQDEQNLICITDNRVAFGDFSGEHLSLKATPVLFGYWQVMFAGNDVDQAEPIIRAVRKNLTAMIDKVNRPLEPEEVAAIVDDAYAEQLQAQIENKILRKHGFNAETFQKHGKLRCTPEVYGKTWDRIDREKLSLQFLVCGFDPDYVANIWLVDGENAPRSYNEIEFWAIGSGAAAALSRLALYSSIQGGMSSLEEALYVGLTAKFSAESASDVGPSTFATILKFPHHRKTLIERPDSCCMVSDDAIERIRKIWNRTGVPPMPEAARKALAAGIAEGTEAFKRISKEIRSERRKNREK